MHAAGRRAVADAPILFIGIVIGVALLFRVAVGAAREATSPPVEAPTFTTTSSSSPEATATPATAAASTSSPASAAAAAATGTATATGTSIGTATAVGAATATGASRRGIPMARDPDARDLAPAPPRVAPRPRGHGRRVPHGG